MINDSDSTRWYQHINDDDSYKQFLNSFPPGASWNQYRKNFMDSSSSHTINDLMEIGA